MKTHPGQVLSLALILAASAASRIFAAENKTFQGPAWALLDAKKVAAAARNFDPKRLPDCDEVCLDAKELVLVHPDGTAETQIERYTKVLTEAGRRRDNVLQQWLNTSYMSAEVPVLEIISPDGAVRSVDVAANQSEGSAAFVMKMNIYDPEYRTLKVNIPGLEIGDTIHSVVHINSFRPILTGQFFDIAVLEGEAYVRHLLYELRTPTTNPLKSILLRHPVGHTVTASTAKEGDLLVYRWDVNDVPRMYREPGMPLFEECLQHLDVGTETDWKAYSRWYWNLSKPHLEAITPEMRHKVATLTAGATTDMEKIQPIFYYVSGNVRYMGVTLEKSRPGFEPHDVNLTYERKYGVCRDKAALLVSLLRAAGLKAYPVLISLGWKMDPEVPNPWFNHAIVAVESRPGEYTLMDPTDENTTEILPSYDTDQSYLVCRPEGETLKVSPTYPVEKNLLKISTVARIDTAGNLEAKSSLHFEGVNDDIIRGMFAQMKPDDRRRFFAQQLQYTVPGARLTSLKVVPENMLDRSIPLQVEMGFSAAARAAFGQDKAVVGIPWIGRTLGVVNYILNNTGLARRKYPMETHFACGVRENLSLDLASNFTGAISVPSAAPVDDESLGYQRSLSFAGHTFTGTKELDLKASEFSPKEYLNLKRTMKDVAYDDRKCLVLSIQAPPAARTSATSAGRPPPPVESDARTLLAETVVTAEDAHTAVTRTHYIRQILNYAGKKKEAEIKIPFNPATQEVKLLSGAVTSKTGQHQAVSKDELNTMDAEWDAGAKRYTGGKILVANLPGIDIGSTIDVAYEVTTRKLPCLAGFVEFQRTDESDQKSFRINAPPGLKIHSRVFGPAGIVTEASDTEAGREEISWQAGRMKAVPNENRLPPPWTYAPGVAYFIGDTDAYFHDVNQAMIECSHRNAKAGELARELAKNAGSPLATIRAIRDYVCQHIRKAGPSFTELPLSELSGADTTLADGYGHPGDQAILLYSMLGAAGFQPEFVLGSDLPSIAGISEVATTFPLAHSFRDPLVRVSVDGETYCLNDTDQYAHLGTTPHDGRLCVVLGSGACETIHAAKDCRDGYDTSYAIALGDDGRARVTVHRRFFGLIFNLNSRYYAEVRPEEKRRHLQQLANVLVQGARPVGPLKTNFQVYPGSEEYTVEIDQYAVVDGNFLYANLLPFGVPVFQARSDQRVLPLMLGRNNWSAAHAEISYPASYRQIDIAPRDEDLSEPYGAGSTRITTHRSEGKFVIDYQSDYVRALVQPGGYSSILTVENALKNPAGKMLLLERIPPPPAAPGT